MLIAAPAATRHSTKYRGTSTRGRVGASLDGDFVQTALCCLTIAREPLPSLLSPQQKCFLLLAIPLPMLFSCLLLLQPDGYFSLSLWAMPKACTIQALDTVPSDRDHDSDSFPALAAALLPSPPGFRCAVLEGHPPPAPARASPPLAQPVTWRQHPTSAPLGSPVSPRGHTYKIPVVPQPRHARPKPDSTGTWDFQPIFQKRLMATSAENPEVSELLQDKAYCEEAPEDTGDGEMTQDGMDQER